MRSDDHYDVLVIGAGPAGTSAALRAAELGAGVAVGFQRLRIARHPARRRAPHPGSRRRADLGCRGRRLHRAGRCAPHRHRDRRGPHPRRRRIDHPRLARSGHRDVGDLRRGRHGDRMAGGCRRPRSRGGGRPDSAVRDPGGSVLLQLGAAQIDDRTPGFLKLISDRRRELILGAQAVGENAIEEGQSVTTAMAGGIDPATLAGVKFAHPTYSAIIGLAARKLLDEPETA